MDAPMGLRNESYEEFLRRIFTTSGNAGTELASVDDELRRLNIDPGVFYRGTKRVELRRFDPENPDISVPPVTDDDAIAEGFRNPPPVSVSEALQDSDLPAPEDGGWFSGSTLFAPPTRQLPSSSSSAGIPRLNVPEDEDSGCELLDAGVGETMGGRFACETPRGIEGKLQIDSLTEEGDDEDFFRDEVIAAPNDLEEPQVAGNCEGDVVESFELDPDFNYDNVPLASRWDD